MSKPFGSRWGLFVATGFCLLAPAWPRAGQPANPAEPWKFDVIHLKSGKVWQGLITAETSASVSILPVRRNPGEPTRLLPATSFERSAIDHIDALDPKERQRLRERLRQLSPAGEKQRLAGLLLKPAPWNGSASGALAYQSRYFVLLSDAPENTVRRAADRLEQIYAAYANFLPPRRPAAQPTTIRLLRSPAEYQKLLQSQRLAILNPAFYDAGTNQILCGCDLQQLEDELDAVRKEHVQLLDRLHKLENALSRQYHGKVPPDRRQEITKTEREIRDLNARNEQVFQEATRRLFQTLYHEAFHAYLANFVYPPAEAAVPRWLNEGLAQIFETAIPEAGELSVGRPDGQRLRRAQAAERTGQLVSLSDLLRSGPEQFLVGHASDQQVSDRHYLASWALAFYLAFERRILSTPELDAYVRALNRGADPETAFRELVKEPLPQFEKAFRRYLRCLRGNGSTARLVKERQSGRER